MSEETYTVGIRISVDREMTKPLPPEELKKRFVGELEACLQLAREQAIERFLAGESDERRES